MVRGDREYSRRPCTLIATLVTTTWTLRRVILEETATLLTLPTHPSSRFPPCSSKSFELAVNFCLAVGLSITRISGGPFGKLCGLASTSGASYMLAVLADGCLSGDEDGVALVAGAPDALLGGLIDEFVSGTGTDGEHALSLWLVGAFLFGLLLLGRLLLGIARTFLAASVLALDTGPVCTVEGAAAVAAAMDTHTDGLLDTLEGRQGVRGGDPFMGFQSEAVLCKEGTGTLLLHSVAVHGLGGRRGWG
jgi:hypothetical protein